METRDRRQETGVGDSGSSLVAQSPTYAPTHLRTYAQEFLLLSSVFLLLTSYFLFLPSCTLDKANRDNRVSLTLPPPTGGTTGTTGGGTTGTTTGGGTTGSIGVGGPEDFDPSVNEPPFESPEETADEVPETPVVCEFAVSQSSIDFGRNQVGQRECATITVSPCVTGTAEIDDSSAVDDELAEFTLLSGTLAGGFTVCYERVAVGGHTGRINITGNAGTAPIAHAITLSGGSSPILFTISEPVPDQLVYECDDVSTPVDGGFSIPASGMVEEELEPLFSSREVTISSGGQSATFPVGDGFGFSGTAFVPDTPAPYSIDFSMQTSRGVLGTSVNVIRFTGPDGTVEVRDGNGNAVSVVEPAPDSSVTDDQGLIIGVAVPNLPLSGPRADYPVRISIKIAGGPDGTIIKTYAGGEDWEDGDVEATPVNFHNNFFVGTDEATLERKCPGSFTNSDTAYCLPLPPLAELPRGANRITVTLRNRFTDCEGPFPSYSTTVIIDNGLPVIEITNPRDNKIYDPMNHVILEGIVKNYAPPTGEGADRVCPLKLWLNSAVKPETEIAICPFQQEGIEQDPTSGNQGNVRRGRFRIDLTETHASLLQFYTNLIQLRVTNVQGHMAIKTVSFQRGKFHPSTFSSLRSGEESVLVGDIKTGNIGDLSPWNGTTRKAPIMLNISEGTLKDGDLIAVIEKAINDPEDGIHLEDLIQGYIPDDDGEIPSDIEASSHMPGVAKVMKWLEPENNRRNLDPEETNNACGLNTLGTCAAILFPKNLNDSRLFGSNLKNEDFWSPVVFGKRNSQGKLLDTNDNVIPTRPNGWPISDSDIARIKPDYNFDDIEQGMIKIDEIELEEDGELSLHLTIHGFKGHAFAFAMCEYGALSFPPVMPIVFNIKELKLRLDHVKIAKIQLKSNGREYFLDGGGPSGIDMPENRPCTSQNCTNKLIIDPENLTIAGAREDQRDDFLYVTPDHQCADRRVGAIYDDNEEEANFQPFGCNLDAEFRDQGHARYNWILMETRNDLDYLAIAPGPSLIVQLQEVLRTTIKDMLWCDVPYAMVNPILNPAVFPYPSWFPESQKFGDPTFILDNTDGEITFEQLNDPPDPENPQNPVFTLRPDFAMSDIFIEEGSLQLKLLAEIGASRVPVGNLGDLVSRAGFRDLGYMYRMPGEFDFDSNYPLSEFETIPYASVSVGIEEVLHSATHLLFRKGFRELIEMIDQETADKLDMPGNWTIGIDKVIFGRFDICTQLNGVLETDLPPSLLFEPIKDIFHASALHLDLTLDKNYPPTLLMTPVTGDPDAVELAIGLSNVRIDVKRLVDNACTPEEIEADPSCNRPDGYVIGCTEAEREIDPSCDRPIISLRLDGLLQLTVKYRRESRRLEIYIHPIIDMPIYLSVLDRGPVFNEFLVIQELETNLLRSQKLAKLTSVYDPTQVFDPSVEFDVTREETFYAPSVYLEFPDRVTGFDSLEAVQTVQHTPDPNGVCDEEHPAPHYANEMTMMMRAFFAPNVQKAVLGKNFSSSRRYGGPSNKDTNPIDSGGIVLLDDCASDNEIDESLCEMGIDDITFGTGYPNLILDADNGYLHLSTKLFLHVYEWLAEEVAVDE